MIASTLAVAIHAALGDLRWLAERIGPAVTEAWDHAAAVMRKQPRLGGAWAQWSRRAAGLPEPRAELSTADVKRMFKEAFPTKWKSVRDGGKVSSLLTLDGVKPDMQALLNQLKGQEEDAVQPDALVED